MYAIRSYYEEYCFYFRVEAALCYPGNFIGCKETYNRFLLLGGFYIQQGIGSDYTFGNGSFYKRAEFGKIGVSRISVKIACQIIGESYNFV